MKKTFAVSLCREGILGGGLYVGESKLIYRTDKLTVSPALKRLEMPFSEICSIRRECVFVFSLVSFGMKNDETYKFLVFAPRALMATLDELGLGKLIINM